jgi:hypothetical protein
MSSGDKGNDPIKFTINSKVDEVSPILRLPIVIQMLQRPTDVNLKDWDLPYLGGYSIDGKLIYIDRDMPASFPWLSKQIETRRFIILHEKVEKALIDAIHDSTGKELKRLLNLLRMTSPDDAIYYHTHGVAEAYEEFAVRMAYGPSGLKAYNKFMVGQVKRAEDERLRRVPANLDLTPYTSSEDPEDRKLLAVMKQKMVA